MLSEETLKKIGEKLGYRAEADFRKNFGPEPEVQPEPQAETKPEAKPEPIAESTTEAESKQDD